jgi:lipopolysaccharide heptosyltransferase II
VPSPQRILVRLPNWLGDALLSRPLLHAVSRTFPDASVTAWGLPPLLETLATDRAWREQEPWSRSAAARRASVARLRASRFDLALVLPPSFSSAWWAWRTGARARVGFATDARAPLLTHAVPRPERGDLHLSEEYLELAHAIGAVGAELPSGPILAPADAGRAAARDRLAAWTLAGSPYAVLGPGAIYGPAKRWPAERFAAVGSELVARGLGCLVCGTAAEREVCAQVAESIGPGARSLAGQTPLSELAALCAGAAVAVCNDSGLAHLAAAVGAPTVVVFGSTSSAWTAPLGPRVRVVQRAPVCSPCFQRTCRVGYRCLQDVHRDDVLRACAAVGAQAA